MKLIATILFSLSLIGCASKSYTTPSTYSYTPPPSSYGVTGYSSGVGYGGQVTNVQDYYRSQPRYCSPTYSYSPSYNPYEEQRPTNVTNNYTTNNYNYYNK